MEAAMQRLFCVGVGEGGGVGGFVRGCELAKQNTGADFRGRDTATTVIAIQLPQQCVQQLGPA